ncbi:carbon-nitrogen hydrolase family protein [Helicobacter aurati]|uniref:Carbon-nitrogen hydrolase family protein n=1 Tax=Helicobacter aurati TaxID=137778 RepID=A0A3D8IZ91_9HELI|nr:carbon-nitrogen hydrolase family protein [Helicobacter aurati]RDU70306.1 carbon-nitrogen hydrolase family protein [Helicobacter aurati]
MKEPILFDCNNYIAILQFENLKDNNRITTYLKSIPEASIVLIGEYVLDTFFSSHWHTKPPESLKDKQKLDFLIELSALYNHTIAVPIIQYKNKGYYKNIAIINKKKSYFYSQQRMIQYQHWNEATFFSNDTSKLLKLPFVFNAGNLRYGVLFGFEAHFDELWMELKRANVDVVLVATASTFSSQARWEALLTTHAFTNSCFVARANRIGKVIANDGYEWDFYGHSFVSLGQNIIDSLRADEGMLCVDIDKESLESLKTTWGFRS